MARLLRIEFPGAVYHVTSRGNHRRPIVRDDEDREMFVHLLGRVVLKFGLKLYAWVLLTNHYHLFCRTPEPNLSRAIQMLNQLYAEYFSRRHRRVGHLFQGRYKAFLVDTDTYFREVARYVVLNPVRAGMCKTAGDYRFHHNSPPAGLLQPGKLYEIDVQDRGNRASGSPECPIAMRTEDLTLICSLTLIRSRIAFLASVPLRTPPKHRVARSSPPYAVSKEQAVAQTFTTLLISVTI